MVVFKNRAEAGKKLVQALKKYKEEDAVIYALPRGGVVVAAEVAQKLNKPLDLIIIRKIGHPENPEYAVCAISENGYVLCNEAEVSHLNRDWLENEILSQRAEIKRRHKAYLGKREPISANGKVAIIIDDGIATGMTMMTAIHEIKHQNVRKIIVAVPIAPKDVVDKLKQNVDGVVVLDIPEIFAGSVGAYYNYFPQVTDKKVITLMGM